MTRASVLSCAWHEAGHALARWWLGFHTDKITVLTLDEMRAEVAIEDRRRRAQKGLAGAVDGYDIHHALARETVDSDAPPEVRAMLLRNAPRRVEASMLQSFAGPLAEARFRRCSAISCYLFGGDRDLDAIRLISRDWFGSDEARAPFVNRAEKLAGALVRSPKAQVAMSAIAAEIGGGGVMDGERVDEICADVFGAEMEHDRWADCWPPTPKQIREGFLPTRSRR